MVQADLDGNTAVDFEITLISSPHIRPGGCDHAARSRDSTTGIASTASASVNATSSHLAAPACCGFGIKPTDNVHIEAFNSRLWAECLNASWFLSLADARQRLEARRREYNEERPHESLRNLTPRAFAEQALHAREVA